jgi:hypothetical protein
LRPAGLDAGEITDQGYVNQWQVLARRWLNCSTPSLVPAGVVVAERTA